MPALWTLSQARTTDAGNAGRDADDGTAAGEGLLIDMGVMENPRSQHLSAGTEDFKFVGEMIPAGVGVGDGDRKVIPVTAGRRFGLHHGGLAGGGNGGSGYIGGQQNGWGRKYYISIHGLWPPLQLVKANRQGDQI